MAYCTFTDVRVLTNLAIADISDADLTSIITYATYQLNHDISTEVVRERIEYIDNTRENDRDGVNTTYYVKNWEGKYLADRNDDGTVTVADIEVVKVASDGTESSVTVSTITHDQGKFVISSAVSSDYDLYVTYKWSYVNCSTPSPLVKMACVVLTAAWAYGKINFGKAPQASFGNIRFYRHMEAFDKFYKQYQRIIDQINNKMSDMVEADDVL